ncbi:MAG TPA: serine/threonine-protein kinase, partial [Rhizomicrobium sp.]|nr:serine/threonine-protein kinase [Rhizomicrobium sp.]
MTPEADAAQSARLAQLFQEALDLPADRRSAYLERECGTDAELRREVSALLAADDSAASNDAWQHNALENEKRIAAATPDAALGETIGSYRIVGVIGSGGMGKVYRAVRADAQFEKSVAIKRIRRDLDADQIMARFRGERQILAGLDHPNIARLLDGGADDDGLPYIVMEYIEGAPPPAYLRQNALTLPQCLTLFRKVCAAVHYAHQRMVIHRDLKPGNILVTAEGEPKLLDFGLARLIAAESDFALPRTESGLHAMTVRYASPEQVRGQTVTTASDIYSLGVILYEMLTGHSPYRNPERSSLDLMRAVSEEDPVRPSEWRRELRGDLDNILGKALAKDPAMRYSSADQFSEDIARFLDGRPVAARRAAFSYVAAKFVRRNKIVVAAAAIVVLTLVSALVVVARARARAERRFNEVRRLAHSVVFDYHDAIENLPGATPVRERLVADALIYLNSLADEADDPGLQREIVDAYVRIGNVQGNSYYANLGNVKGAMDSSRKAVTMAERLLQ